MTEQLRSLASEVLRAILAFVDDVVPESGEVWLTGSRLRGDFRPDSDWDIIAFSKYASSEPADLFKSNQTSQHKIQGGNIELVIAHPDHWNDPSPYMSELRQSGLRLR
jgi:predicted nucleotidyltransferase